MSAQETFQAATDRMGQTVAEYARENAILRQQLAELQREQEEDDDDPDA